MPKTRGSRVLQARAGAFQMRDLSLCVAKHVKVREFQEDDNVGKHKDKGIQELFRCDVEP